MASDKRKLLFHDKVPYFARTKLILTQVSDTTKWERESALSREEEGKKKNKATRQRAGINYV